MGYVIMRIKEYIYAAGAELFRKMVSERDLPNVNHRDSFHYHERNVQQYG